MAKKKISMTIDDNIYDAFKLYCQRNGMKVSTKVELLMKKSLEDTTLQNFIK